MCLNPLLLFLVEVGDQREPEHQRLDALQPEDHQRVADRADVLAAAVKAGVDRAEDLAGEGRVLGDDAGDLGDVDVRLLRKVQHLHRDRRQRRQVRALPDALKQLVVHVTLREAGELYLPKHRFRIGMSSEELEGHLVFAGEIP